MVADARVANLGNYFVGDRIGVWIGVGDRQSYIVPESFVHTRFGLDYVNLRQPDGQTVEAPVQRGIAQPSAAMRDGLEILSGVRTGDILVNP